MVVRIPRVLYSAVFATAAFLVITVPKPSVASAKPAAVAQQVPACKKIVPGSCTSCSTPGIADNECKGGTAFSDCTQIYITCQNGAQCDQDTGIGHCP